mgnify:CR=1 FL=1
MVIIFFKNTNLLDEKSQKRDLQDKIVKKDKFLRQKVSKMTNLYDPPWASVGNSLRIQQVIALLFILTVLAKHSPRTNRHLSRYRNKRQLKQISINESRCVAVSTLC